MHAITYRRVSTQEQGESKNGLEGQQEACKRFCTSEGINLLADYEEVASGGLGLLHRPSLAAALAHAKQAKALLLVSKLDRLSRSVALISALMEQGVGFATAEDGLAVQPMMLHMKAVFAEQERRQGGERTKAAHAARKARGEAYRGFADHVCPMVSQSQALVRASRTNMRKANTYASSIAPTIRALQGAGMTLEQVAGELNRMGVERPRGGLWNAPVVCNLLKRSTLAG